MLDDSFGYGARPEAQGFPKIAVLITDGRSNLHPVQEQAEWLRQSGVQVRGEGVRRGVWGRGGHPVRE